MTPELLGRESHTLWFPKTCVHATHEFSVLEIPWLQSEALKDCFPGVSNRRCFGIKPVSEQTVDQQSASVVFRENSRGYGGKLGILAFLLGWNFVRGVSPTRQFAAAVLDNMGWKSNTPFLR